MPVLTGRQNKATAPNTGSGLVMHSLVLLHHFELIRHGSRLIVGMLGVASTHRSIRHNRGAVPVTPSREAVGR